MVRSSNRSFLELIKKNREAVGYMFIGAGLCLFVLNITSLISFVTDVNYPHAWFDVSIFSSMLIVIIATYTVFLKKNG